jgi:hypothetical protein
MDPNRARPLAEDLARNGGYINALSRQPQAIDRHLRSLTHLLERVPDETDHLVRDTGHLFLLTDETLYIVQVSVDGETPTVVVANRRLEGTTMRLEQVGPTRDTDWGYGYKRAWTITFPDGEALTFHGVITDDDAFRDTHEEEDFAQALAARAGFTIPLAE